MIGRSLAQKKKKQPDFGWCVCVWVSVFQHTELQVSMYWSKGKECSFIYICICTYIQNVETRVYLRQQHYMYWITKKKCLNYVAEFSCMFFYEEEKENKKRMFVRVSVATCHMMWYTVYWLKERLSTVYWLKDRLSTVFLIKRTAFNGLLIKRSAFNGLLIKRTAFNGLLIKRSAFNGLFD